MVLIGVCSCNSRDTQSEPELSKNIEIINSDILGEWRLNKANLVSYNVRPIIFFNKDGSGNITNSSGEKEVFEWSHSNETRIIILTRDYSLLKSGAYDINFQDKENFVQLQMKSTNEGLVYILGR